MAILCTTGVADDATVSPRIRVRPEAVGMSSARLQRIDDVVAYGLARKRMPGCVVLVGRKGRIVFHEAYGQRRLLPEPESMTLDTVFDLASLTKPIATATSVMMLVEQGKLELNAPVAKYIPEFGANGKEAITIQQLLTHQGGLIPDNSIRDYDHGRDEALKRIYELKPYVEPGSKFVYTDVGFIVLAELVQRLSGQDIHEFTQEHLFGKLGMRETGYLPSDSLRARAAPTEKRGEQWIQGEVHDPRAYRLDGVAGHAGLFSTSSDLARYAQMMLNQGKLEDARILEPETVERMTRPLQVQRGLRSLGWDVLSGYSSNRGDLMSSRAFGHGGFTGTAIWMDPEHELFVIFLSNRVHPEGKGSVNDLAGRIGTLACAAIEDPRDTPRDKGSPVQTGIDVMRRGRFVLLKEQRVGLITNQTGRTADGQSTFRILHESPDVQLTTIFSPEHGLEGKLDIPKIEDTKDDKTGLSVVSLYGKTRKPTAEHLANLDTLVFDIQDIGTRFYTYISTMGNAMEAAAEHGVRFVVLDRPNPIGGLDVQGPVLDTGLESFVGHHALPVRHGMTVGEIACMLKAERKLNLSLHVVRCEGWRRGEYWDATGLTWINPSPNMRNLTQAFLYPGIGLMETTNVSVGRGTDTPFEVVGAPWMDGRQVAREMNAAGLPGLRCVPIRFIPMSSKYANQTCGGVNLIVTDRRRFHPLRTGLALATVLRRLYPKAWETKNLNRLLCDQAAFDSIVQGKPADGIQAAWQSELEAFRLRRNGFLLYD